MRISNENQRQSRIFLKKSGIDLEKIDYEQKIKAIIKQMDKGLAGSKSSLKMLATYIESNVTLPLGKNIIILDAGGTHLRVALGKFKKSGEIKFSYYKKHGMPGAKRAVTKEYFFKKIFEYLKPIIKKSDRIGFCFSYAMEKNKKKDGKVLKLVKEVQIRGLEGSYIGDELNKVLKKNRFKEKKIILLNDTVSTSLAGKIFSIYKSYESYIGFILGTGVNMAYVEKGKNIKKLKNSKDQLINTEFGGVDVFADTKIDWEVFYKTIEPEIFHFEKMVGGGYFGEICLSYFKAAALKKFFSQKGSAFINRLDSLQTKDVNKFILNPIKNEGKLSHDDLSVKDKEILYYIIDYLIERSVKFCAIAISAVAIKTNAGKNPLKPICINLDGYTIHAMKGFKTKLEYELITILNKQHNIYFDLVKLDHSPLIGAAIAGLIN